MSGWIYIAAATSIIIVATMPHAAARAVLAALFAALSAVLHRVNKPDRSSVTLEGARVVVRNPTADHVFDANQLFVARSKASFGKRKAAVLIDRKGRFVAAFGLAESYGFGSTNLHDFEVAVARIGAKLVDDVVAYPWSKIDVDRLADRS